MLAKQEASTKAKEFINQKYQLEDDELIIQEIFETEDTFICHYESKKFHETDNPVYAVMIHIPIVVQKSDGSCMLNP